MPHGGCEVKSGGIDKRFLGRIEIAANGEQTVVNQSSAVSIRQVAITNCFAVRYRSGSGSKRSVGLPI